ncbi:SAM-dependent methyltransferase, partial [Enterococcus thailandicus]
MKISNKNQKFRGIQMNEKEWDDFAEEYYEIQQESQTTIAED